MHGIVRADDHAQLAALKAMGRAHQNCRNDNLSMRRHTHTMVARSTIPEAGWGLFVKNGVPKGVCVGVGRWWVSVCVCVVVCV